MVILGSKILIQQKGQQKKPLTELVLGRFMILYKIAT
jgi:hypothetical protein